MFAAIATASAAFAAPMLIPAPREMSVTGGRVALAAAAARHITIVPEIDFPGHFRAVVRAYPKFACAKGARNAMCVGNPEAVRFAEKVLDRVCELFPSKVVHIGGDECKAGPWSNPDPAKRDFAEFSARAAEHRRRLIRDHVNCAPLK